MGGEFWEDYSLRIYDNFYLFNKDCHEAALQKDVDQKGSDVCSHSTLLV